MQGGYLSAQPGWLTNLLALRPLGLPDPRELGQSQELNATDLFGTPAEAISRDGSDALMQRILDNAASKSPAAGLFDTRELDHPVPPTPSGFRIAPSQTAQQAHEIPPPDSSDALIQRILHDATSGRTPIELFDPRESTPPPSDFRVASPQAGEAQRVYEPTPPSRSGRQFFFENRPHDPNGYYPFDKNYFDAQKQWKEILGSVLGETLHLGVGGTLPIPALGFAGPSVYGDCDRNGCTTAAGLGIGYSKNGEVGLEFGSSLFPPIRSSSYEGGKGVGGVASFPIAPFIVWQPSVHWTPRNGGMSVDLGSFELGTGAQGVLGYMETPLMRK